MCSNNAEQVKMRHIEPGLGIRLIARHSHIRLAAAFLMAAFDCDAVEFPRTRHLIFNMRRPISNLRRPASGLA